MHLERVRARTTRCARRGCAPSASEPVGEPVGEHVRARRTSWPTVGRRPRRRRSPPPWPPFACACCVRSVHGRVGSLPSCPRPASGAPTPRPSVSVVMPAHNEAELLDQTLKELVEGAARTRDLAFEVLVVENGSTRRHAGRSPTRFAADDPTVSVLTRPRRRLRRGAAGRDPRRRGRRRRGLRRRLLRPRRSSTDVARALDRGRRPGDRRRVEARAGHARHAALAAPAVTAGSRRVLRYGFGLRVSRHPRHEGDAARRGRADRGALPQRHRPLRHRARAAGRPRRSRASVEVPVSWWSAARRARRSGAGSRARWSAWSGSASSSGGTASPTDDVDLASPRPCRSIRSPRTRSARSRARSSSSSTATTPTCSCASRRRTSSARSTTSRSRSAQPARARVMLGCTAVGGRRRRRTRSRTAPRSRCSRRRCPTPRSTPRRARRRSSTPTAPRSPAGPSATIDPRHAAAARRSVLVPGRRLPRAACDDDRPGAAGDRRRWRRRRRGPGGNRLVLDDRIVTERRGRRAARRRRRCAPSCRRAAARSASRSSSRAASGNLVDELGGPARARTAAGAARRGRATTTASCIRAGLHVGLVVDEHQARLRPRRLPRAQRARRRPATRARSRSATRSTSGRPCSSTSATPTRPTRTCARCSPASSGDAALLFTCNGRGAQLLRRRPTTTPAWSRSCSGRPARGRVLRRRDRPGRRPQLPARLHRQPRPVRADSDRRSAAGRDLGRVATRRLTRADRAERGTWRRDDERPASTELETARHQRDPRPRDGRGAEGELRAPGHADGARAARPRAVDPDHELRRRRPDWPDRDRFVLSAGHASMLLYSMLYLTGFGLELDDLRAVPAVGLAHAGPPRVPATRRASRSPPVRSARASPTPSGIGARRGATCAARFGAEVVDHHVVRDLRRRRPRGGRQPRGGVARRPPRARPPRRRLRRQPHHHRRPHRARVQRRRPEALRGRTAGTSSSSARSPTTSTRSRPGSATGMAEADRPSLVVLRSHIGYPSPKYTDTAKAHGNPLGADEVAAVKEILGLPAGGLLRPRRRARATTAPPARAARRRARRGSSAAPRSATPSPSSADELRRVPRAARARRLGAEAARRGRPGEAIATRARVRRGARRDRRRRARAASAAAPTSPATPARSSKDAPVIDDRTTSAAARSTSASASTAWAAIMNGMAVSGLAARRRHVLRVQRLHARRRCGSPRSRGTRSRSSGRTTRSASARTARPTSRSSSSRRCGRCPASGVIRPADANEVAPGVAGPHRRRRARPRSSSPARSSRCSTAPPSARPKASPRGAYVLVDEDRRRPRPRAHRHRLRGVAVRRRRASCSPPTGSSVRVVSMPSWDLFAAQPDDVPRRGAPARRADARGRGRRELRLGALRRRRRRHRPLRRVGARATSCSRELGFTPENVVGARRALLATRGGPMTERDRPAQRLRAEPVVRQPRPPALHRRRARAARRRRRHPRRHVEPDDLRQGDRRRRGLRRAAARRARRQGVSIEDTYWDARARRHRRTPPTCCARCYDALGGGDGFVSVEVSPDSRTTPTGTIAQATVAVRRGSTGPNVMIKIPATLEGIPAIEETIAAGINVNVTLIFSLDRHAEVIEAYLDGPRAARGARRRPRRRSRRWRRSS